MLDELSKRKLRFLVMPTRFVHADYERDLAKAYSLWKDVWGEALKNEMNIQDPLYSDNFTRHSLVAVVFFGKDPLCLATLNYFDLTLQRDLDDSYFKVWPQNVLDDVRKNATRVMASCNATVNFKFRKGKLGVSGIDFLCAMLVQYLKSTDRDAILCTPRREKHVQEACYRTGATLHEENVPYTIPGQQIDLICWYQTLDQERWNPDLKELVRYVWKNKTEIVLPSQQQGKNYAA